METILFCPYIASKPPISYSVFKKIWFQLSIYHAAQTNVPFPSSDFQQHIPVLFVGMALFKKILF